MMIFRNVPNPDLQPTAEQIQATLKQWQDWIAGIAAQGKLVTTSQLGKEAKTLKADKSITAGPYAEVKEIIGGFLVLKAASVDEAVEHAKGCPIYQSGGHVEVRDVIKMS